jgi:hypothetical protein
MLRCCYDERISVPGSRPAVDGPGSRPEARLAVSEAAGLHRQPLSAQQPAAEVRRAGNYPNAGDHLFRALATYVAPNDAPPRA